MTLLNKTPNYYTRDGSWEKKKAKSRRRRRNEKRDAGELLLLEVPAERNPFGKRADKTSSSGARQASGLQVFYLNNDQQKRGSAAFFHLLFHLSEIDGPLCVWAMQTRGPSTLYESLNQRAARFKDDTTINFANSVSSSFAKNRSLSRLDTKRARNRK